MAELMCCPLRAVTWMKAPERLIIPKVEILVLSQHAAIPADLAAEIRSIGREPMGSEREVMSMLKVSEMKP